MFFVYFQFFGFIGFFSTFLVLFGLDCFFSAFSNYFGFFSGLFSFFLFSFGFFSVFSGFCAFFSVFLGLLFSVYWLFCFRFFFGFVVFLVFFCFFFVFRSFFFLLLFRRFGFFGFFVKWFCVICLKWVGTLINIQFEMSRGTLIGKVFSGRNSSPWNCSVFERILFWLLWKTSGQGCASYMSRASICDKVFLNFHKNRLWKLLGFAEVLSFFDWKNFRYLEKKFPLGCVNCIFRVWKNLFMYHFFRRKLY